MNSRQATKIKSELLEKFEVAVDKKQKHSVIELFRLIHGIRRSYTDVDALIGDDECSKIIYALKKTPGIVSYKQGKFKYSGIGKSSVFRFIDRWYTIVTTVSFSFFAIASLLILFIGKGSASIVGLVLFIISIDSSFEREKL